MRRSEPPYRFRRRLRRGWGNAALFAAFSIAFAISDDPLFTLPPAGSRYSLVAVAVLAVGYIGAVYNVMKKAVEVNHEWVEEPLLPLLAPLVTFSDELVDLRLERTSAVAGVLAVRTPSIEHVIAIRMLFRESTRVRIESEIRALHHLPNP